MGSTSVLRVLPASASALLAVTSAIALVMAADSSLALAQGPVVQDCQLTQYLDRSAPTADRDITWGFAIQSDAERCMQVRVGQQVRWNGSFGSHPLDARGGDTPNPITTHSDGLVTFTAPGIFGYECGLHPQMKGAVRVVAAGPNISVPSGGGRATAASLLALAAIAGWMLRGWRAPSS